MGGFAVDAVYGDLWNGRVAIGYGVQLFLELLYFATGGSYIQIESGPGAWNAFYGLCGIDIDGIAVIIAQNLGGAVALIGQGFAAPLAHAVRTDHSFTIALLGQDGLLEIRYGKIAYKLFVYDTADILKNISSIDPFMVIGGRRSNGKIISFVTIPLCVHSV